MRRAHLQALGLAYLSPQNKSLAQSFRYMRTKPTIIAFKTPSLENCEQRDSAASMITLGKTDKYYWITQFTHYITFTIARRRLSKSLNPDKDKDAEEGKIEVETVDIGSTSDNDSYTNYPVGKPLEVGSSGIYI